MKIVNDAIIKNFILKTVSLCIDLKYCIDKRRGLKCNKEDYKIVNLFYFKNFLRLPNLIKPNGYNEKIQLLKLVDRDPLIVKVVDKLGLKEFVKHEIGESYFPKTLRIGNTVNEVLSYPLPESFVIKTNHDSGSVFIVERQELIDETKLRYHLNLSLNAKYGVDQGEWPYAKIEPKVFIEEMLPLAQNGAPPPDYKFHCQSGELLWVQFIYDRGRKTKEIIVDSDGSEMGVNFDQNMESGIGFVKPKVWREMVSIAEKLSIPFRYVRVDLYLIGDKIYVGELTFHPLSGCYKSKGERVLGRMLTKVKQKK
jgi:hypothetical protein